MKETIDSAPVPVDGPRGFGARLRILRLRNEQQQCELAKRLHCHKDSLGSWERGESYPTYWFLMEIATFFNADIAWLTGMEYGTNTGGSRK